MPKVTLRIRLPARRSRELTSRQTRRELLAALERRKVRLTGGRWVQGTSFTMKNFDREHLLQLLDGSVPLTEDDRTRIRVGLGHFLRPPPKA